MIHKDIAYLPSIDVSVIYCCPMLPGLNMSIVDGVHHAWSQCFPRRVLRGRHDYSFEEREELFLPVSGPRSFVWTKRSYFEAIFSTRSMIHRLVVLVVNTGLATTVSTLLTIIFVRPTTFASPHPRLKAGVGRRSSQYICLCVFQFPDLTLVRKLCYGQSQLSRLRPRPAWPRIQLRVERCPVRPEA